jgi:hypothetical protein
MTRTLTLWTTLGLIGSTALAEETETETEGEESGYRDVVLADGGPTVMEDKRDYDQIVTVGFKILPSTVKTTYRHSVSDNLSVMVGAGFGSAAWILGGDDNATIQRVISTAGLDYHPVGNGLHGFFIGPRASYTVWSADSDGEEVFSSTRLDISGLIGWRWIYDPGVAVSIGLGARYTDVIREAGDSGDFSFIREGVGFAREIQLGWVF